MTNLDLEVCDGWLVADTPTGIWTTRHYAIQKAAGGTHFARHTHTNGEFRDHRFIKRILCFDGNTLGSAGLDIKLLKPVARGASRFGKLLARLTDKIITYWTTACDIPTISNLNTSKHTCCHRKPARLLKKLRFFVSTFYVHEDKD